MNITKVQKLLYIAYGIHLAESGERLFEEHPQCWPYGPVFPSTRNKLIKEKRLWQVNDTTEDQNLKNLIVRVFDKFGSQTATWLSEWSHAEGSPWDKTRQRVGFIWGMQIDDSDIEEYFKMMLA